MVTGFAGALGYGVAKDFIALSAGALARLPESALPPARDLPARPSRGKRRHGRDIWISAVYREVRSQADRYLATSPRPVALPPDI
jgi:hypothetical protein